MKVRERIRSIRKSKNIPRSELARRLKITRRQVWRVEEGKVGLDVEELPRWARALRSSVVELVGGGAS